MENLNLKIAKALQLGTDSFNKGKNRVPALDSTLMKLLKDLNYGDSVPVLKAWLNGWDIQNLKSAEYTIGHRAPNSNNIPLSI